MITKKFIVNVKLWYNLDTKSTIYLLIQLTTYVEEYFYYDHLVSIIVTQQKIMPQEAVESITIVV